MDITIPNTITTTNNKSNKMKAKGNMKINKSDKLYIESDTFEDAIGFIKQSGIDGKEPQNVRIKRGKLRTLKGWDLSKCYDKYLLKAQLSKDETDKLLAALKIDKIPIGDITPRVWGERISIFGDILYYEYEYILK